MFTSLWDAPRNFLATDYIAASTFCNFGHKQECRELQRFHVPPKKGKKGPSYTTIIENILSAGFGGEYGTAEPE